MNGLGVGAHPFGWKAAALSGSDVPCFGVENGGPWPPRLWRVKDAESAAKAGVSSRQGLAPKIAFERGIVCDPGLAIASADRQFRCVR